MPMQKACPATVGVQVSQPLSIAVFTSGCVGAPTFVRILYGGFGGC